LTPAPVLPPARARALVGAFSRLKIVVVGDLMLDVGIFGEVERVSPEAPVPVVRVTHETATLGGAANVARNLAALGAAALPCGVVGRDEGGRRLLALAREGGLPTEGVVESSSRPTTVKTRVLSRRQQMLRIDRETDRGLDAEEERALIGRVRDLWGEARALIISDYDKGAVTPGLLDHILPAARERGLPVAVDPKIRNFPRYRPITAITPNRHEAARALKVPVQSEAEVEAAGRAIQERLGHPTVLLTLGEGGVAVFEPSGGLTRIPACAREVFDVSGAGDTVVAALALGLAAGASPVEAAALANAAAGVVVGKLGTAVASGDEVLAAFASA
jgi:D-beta-D-heptose 7-phosphate kinase/D-beta-D-heptose 1-phosphate adenosyltransferase